MSHHEQINRLFLTNNYSIVSKYSAVKIGYFNDKILEDFIENYLISKSWRRTPLVNRGYAARLMAIDWIVNKSMSVDPVECFIVLGAGYDTLPFRKTNNCCWIELDLPQVVEVKSRFIRERNILEDEDLIPLEPLWFNSRSMRYHLIACDLRNLVTLTDILQRILARLANHSISPKNFAIINEVCLCYIDTNEIKKLLETVINTIRESAHRVNYIGYEQVKPEEDSQFSSIMLDHFKSLGHPLKHYPTSEQLHQLLEDQLGFNQVKTESMHKLFHDDLNKLRKEYTGYREEPFDEFEEMDLYLSHYTLVTGLLNIKASTEFQSCNSHTSQDYVKPNIDSQLIGVKMNTSMQVSYIESNIQRFGHSSCLITSSGGHQILMSGGFGKGLSSSLTNSNDQKHKRLSDCILVSRDQSGSMDTSTLDINDVMNHSINLNRMHGQICELSEGLFFFNGGRQSPVKHNQGNIPFLTNLIGKRLIVKHRFEFEATKQTLRWRHRTLRINEEEVIQLGGIAHDLSEPRVTIWNFSSDKLGFRENSSDINLHRHSFAMDRRDANTLLVFGGLMTPKGNAMMRDKPVCQSALLWDLREERPNNMELLNRAQCYGSNVHFISVNQFVNIGGISAINGLANGIELFDLRQPKQICEELPLPECSNGEPLILINTTTCHLKNERKTITIGGGGNYFTFGTSFNKSYLVFEY